MAFTSEAPLIVFGFINFKVELQSSHSGLSGIVSEVSAKVRLFNGYSLMSEGLLLGFEVWSPID